MVPPNRFESLSLSNDDRDDFLLDKHALVLTNIIDKSVRLRNSNTKPDPLQIRLKSPNLNWKPLICKTEKYLSNFVPQRRVTSGNQIYANAVAAEKKKTCIIGDSHLVRITKRSFRTDEERNFVSFKCFWGANTKQLDYCCIEPTLVDEKSVSIILNIGSNDITETNYENVNAEDLGQRIVNIAKKCRLFGVNKIATPSILMRKNISIDKIIKKVNEEISSMCAAYVMTWLMSAWFGKMVPISPTMVPKC